MNQGASSSQPAGHLRLEVIGAHVGNTHHIGGGALDGEIERYSALEEAEHGHVEMVRRVTAIGGNVLSNLERLQLELTGAHRECLKEDERHRQEIRASIVHWERIGGRKAWNEWAEKLRLTMRSSYAS